MWYQNEPAADPEAVALAACYRLLLQKARERQARLARVATEQDRHDHDQQVEANGQNGGLLKES